uniref:G-protein coupled receptors family 3 profile domain-containing protein n=2 Tax=Entomoneis paludosa TaxID=265537 RepID=A0A7S2YHP6_9STRA|mmetsp:Transcript_33245/g.69249  ORF Transcript_33245/g.69249 Transcript_33245/m.69249 type:complete len:294 (+) Transcript_33245:756-1637(+)
MSLTMLKALASMVWLWVYRKEEAIASSNTGFLHVICVGTIIMSATVIPLSLDASSTLSNAGLDVACMSIPWLVFMGNLITYSALFTKLYTTHKMVSFSKKSLYLLAPMVALLSSAILVLILWTTLDPLHYQSKEIDKISGETVHSCIGESSEAYAVSVFGVNLIAMGMVTFMAFKTLDADGSRNETWWIMILLLIQVETVVLAAPIVVALSDQAKPNPQYIGYVLLILSLPSSTLYLLIFPKVLAHYRRDKEGNHKRKRGQMGHGQVTGLDAPNNDTKVAVTATAGECAVEGT